MPGTHTTGAGMDDEVTGLQRELLARLDAHPMEAWSPRLLRAVIAVLDLTQPLPMPPETGGRRLRLVR